MPPTLVVIAGPLAKDASYALDGAELCIGRDLTCGVCVVSKLVSRRHCSIQQQDGRVSIYDLGSRNGTFVNGVPVRERVLQHGDVIAVGDSYFRFLILGREEPGAEQPVVFEDGELSIFSTVSLRKEDVRLPPPVNPPDTARTNRLIRDLGVLVTIASRIGSIQESELLQWQILGMIFDVIPAERGAILLCSDTAEEFTSQVAWDRPAGPQQPMRSREQVK